MTRHLPSFSRQLLFLVATAGVLYPLYFMVTTALKGNTDYTRNKLGLPSSATLTNFSAVIHDPHVVEWFANSTVITVASVAIAIAAATLAAYAIARGSGGWTGGILTGMIALMAVPPVVLVIPLFVMMARLGLLNNRLSVILVYSGLLIPLSVYLLVGFFRGIPTELDEAALMDGASRLRVLLHVLLPLARPAFLTLAVVNAVYVWNEFLIALLFLQSETSQTLMVGISSFQGRFHADEPLLMAWSVVASAPIVLLYILGQRVLVRGLVAGALK
jgi:ABC-type glycerol-3-phosphate transport system permease component